MLDYKRILALQDSNILSGRKIIKSCRGAVVDEFPSGLGMKAKETLPFVQTHLGEG